MNSSSVTKMKYHNKSTLETLEKEGITAFQTKWEIVKYETRKLSISFSKLLPESTTKETLF